MYKQRVRVIRALLSLLLLFLSKVDYYGVCLPRAALCATIYAPRLPYLRYTYVYRTHTGVISCMRTDECVPTTLLLYANTCVISTYNENVVCSFSFFYVYEKNAFLFNSLSSYHGNEPNLRLSTVE